MAIDVRPVHEDFRMVTDYGMVAMGYEEMFVSGVYLKVFST